LLLLTPILVVAAILVLEDIMESATATAVPYLIPWCASIAGADTVEFIIADAFCVSESKVEDAGIEIEVEVEVEYISSK
jgi:hypothetical protein